MVTIFSSQGDPLTEASIRLDGGARVVALADLDDPGALLQYFFGRGQREVLVEVAARQVPGRLETRWQGNDRLWVVTTQTALVEREPQPERARPDAAPVPRAAVS